MIPRSIKCECEITRRDIIDQHDNEEASDDRQQIEVLHQDHITDAPCKAHS